MTRRFTALVVAALASLVLVPTIAHAQSAIAGVVKDTSGAVLPGVTVEAASDVLIEKTRSVVTDGAGQYKIVDLRPGVYSVTFSLPGFATVKRDGVELPANFTSTINADLRVGVALVDIYERRLSDPGRAMVELRRLIDLYPERRTTLRLRRELAMLKDERRV